MPKCEQIQSIYRFQLGQGIRKQVIEVVADLGDHPKDTTFDVPEVKDMTWEELRDYGNHLMMMADSVNV
jgi:hypothetical protein